MTTVSSSRHAAALELHAEGRRREAIHELTEEVRDRIGDPSLLNDLGVVAWESGQPALAEASLRLSQAAGYPEAAANLNDIDGLRGDGFLAALMITLTAAALGPDHADNFDPLYMPDGPVGPMTALRPGVAEILRQGPELEWLHRTFADDESRLLMTSLFALRLLGGRKIVVSVGPAELRRMVDATRALCVEAGTADLDFLGWSADRFDLRAVEFEVTIDAHPLNVIHTFLLQQYRCPAHPAARVRAGDIVIDGGGCWGDTALYFADRVGPAGRVLSYEFSPTNLRLFSGNLARNPHLAERIEVERLALWERSGEQLTIEGAGPATHVGAAGSGDGVGTRAIDDLGEVKGVGRVDFIKLDVEGAELAALHGAEQTLRRDRPRLAIALYHQTDDWVEIPGYLQSLDLGYQFSLGHFTQHHHETVLYAWTDDAPRLDERSSKRPPPVHTETRAQSPWESRATSPPVRYEDHQNAAKTASRDGSPTPNVRSVVKTIRAEV